VTCRNRPLLADVLAEHTDGVITRHLLVDGIAQGVEEERPSHGEGAKPAIAVERPTYSSGQ